MIADLLFYFFAGLALLCGTLIVFNPVSRSPVNSAMFLVLTIAALSGLFVLLQAYFLAAVQILVYAGAVMVLFLFVIMLLNPAEEERRQAQRLRSVLGVAGVAVFASLLIRAIAATGGSRPHAPAEAVPGATRSLGLLLFTEYILPFEIVSLILLVAMIGVVILSKRSLP